MNQIKNLVGLKFKNLTFNQLLQVVSFYCDENKYDDYYNFEADFNEHQKNYFCNTEEAKLNFLKSWIYSNLTSLKEIKSFFKKWVK